MVFGKTPILCNHTAGSGTEQAGKRGTGWVSDVFGGEGDQVASLALQQRHLPVQKETYTSDQMSY